MCLLAEPIVTRSTSVDFGFSVMLEDVVKKWPRILSGSYQQSWWDSCEGPASILIPGRILDGNENPIGDNLDGNL